MTATLTMITKIFLDVSFAVIAIFADLRYMPVVTFAVNSVNFVRNKTRVKQAH